VADSLQRCLGCAEFCDSLQSNFKHQQPLEEKPTHLMRLNRSGRRGVLGVAEEGDMEGEAGRNWRTMLHGEGIIARNLSAGMCYRSRRTRSMLR
jgi:hypothetical protein